MKLSDFDYAYPEELIATHPLPERSASRMLVADRKTSGLIHSSAQNLPEFLKKGDLLVINDTRVFPARLVGKKESGGRVELLLLKIPLPSPLKKGGRKGFIHCITNQTARLKTGSKLLFDKGLSATVTDRNGDILTVEFNKPELIEEIGLPPLPPYILKKRSMKHEARNTKHEARSMNDKARYQTIFARHIGSAAAPTAGLHFTQELLRKIRTAGVNIATVTLHVGLDTFSPVREENIEDHKMHGEEYFIPKETVESIEQTKNNGGKVVAVGTTSVRVLESFACHCEESRRLSGRRGNPLRSRDCHAPSGLAMTTNLFIIPGFHFSTIDAILTNFHQPRSTLLMLVSSFAGREFIMHAYQEAISQKYRLFSYGDCMLIT